MIGSVRGTLLAHEDDGTVLIEVAGGGLGYRVVLGSSAARALGAVGDEVFVWVHHHIREDTQVLYGFVDHDKRRTFEVLLGAHGVGPALALAILSVHAPDELARIVATEDADALCTVPGVGKKTAARLLIELRSRLDDVPTSPTGAGPASVTPGAGIRTALERLGFRGEEISHVLRTPEVRGAADLETALREALRHIGAQR